MIRRLSALPGEVNAHHPLRDSDDHALLPNLYFDPPPLNLQYFPFSLFPRTTSFWCLSHHCAIAAINIARASALGPGCVKPGTARIPVVIGLIERLLRRFLGVGNGKATPANVVISRFYTA